MTVANGEKMPSPGVCEGVPVKVNSDIIKMDLCVIPLDGFDVVFGVR